MGTYSYTVARFLPDMIRNEPINIGIIVVDSGTGKTAHRFMDNLLGLGPRCPGADLLDLEEIVGSIQVGDMPDGVDALARLADRHAYSLQFTSPRAVTAPTLEDALRIAFDTYVGEAGADEAAPARTPARIKLLGEIDAEASRFGMGEEAAMPQPEFAGARGVFRPDRAFRVGDGAVALHALPFAAQPGRALRDAKVLAIDYEDAAARTADLECAAIVDQAPGGDNPSWQEMYEQAAGHLKDKNCEVVPAARLSAYVEGIARRAGRAGGSGGRGASRPSAE